MEKVGFMCRSVVVSAGLLRIFGREVAELPLVATSRECQGKVRNSAVHFSLWLLVSKVLFSVCVSKLKDFDFLYIFFPGLLPSTILLY